MADMKDSALTAAGALADTDLVAVTQTVPTTPTGPFKLTLLLLAAYVSGKIRAAAMAMSAAIDEARATALASAATVNIGAAAGNFLHITGTTTITAFDTVQAGARRRLVFDGVLTLTHNATSLILPGAANITTAAGDAAVFVSEGSGNWRCVAYNRANGRPPIPGLPQNSQSAAYTCVLADANKHILHPSADTTARVFTIPANSSVPYEIGTALTFVNQDSAGSITIAITTDTMRMAGAGTTGSRTLAANGMATALKITATEWMINGTGLS